MEIINLDRLSANPLLPEVKEAMIDAIGLDYGNPSSQHRLGDQAAEALDNARNSVSKLINCAVPKELVFTSGGTESVNHAIKGVAQAKADKGPASGPGSPVRHPCHLAGTPPAGAVRGVRHIFKRTVFLEIIQKKCIIIGF